MTKKTVIATATAVAVLAVLGAVWQIRTRPATQPPRLACQQSTVRVTLSADDPTTYRVVGWLCARGPARGKPVQFLLSGATYDHHYWDPPEQPDSYSYVRAATAAGYATFNIDRLGVGLSDRPPATKLTIPAEGYVAYQIVQALRGGRVAATAFSTVIGVGHSLGAAMWLYEAGQYGDVDGLVLADYLHTFNPAQSAVVTASFHPAADDPGFAGRQLPAGYLTTKPGTRVTDFYNPGDVDPAVLAQDEALKQTATVGELTTLSVPRDPKYSLAIRVPTLLAVGQQDSLACAPAANLSCADSAAVLAREQADFAAPACLSAIVLPGAGHDINLHRGAHAWFVAADNWIGTRVGVTGQRLATQSCPAAIRLQAAG